MSTTVVETSGFRDRVRRWVAPVLGVASLLLVIGATEGAAEGKFRSDCPEPEPADEFSEKIDSLLMTVEGSDFPSDANLESWHDRGEDIEATFGEMLELSSGDIERRRATVQALLAAGSLCASPSESRLLGTGLERGEVRAWTRQVLKAYSSMGVTAEDRRFVDADLISGFQQSWGDKEADHPQRSLPLYREKAAALRGLATLRPSPSCK